MPPMPGPPPGGGSGTGTADGGSDTTEHDIPPDVPPDVDGALMTAIALKEGGKGAFTDLSEAARKIQNGQRLASGELVAARKFRELSNNQAAMGIALNVKSTAREVTGSRSDADVTGALSQLLQFLEQAGIITDNSTI